MRGAHSISTRRAYGLQRICRVWHCARSSVYARRQATTSQVPCRRRDVNAFGGFPDTPVHQVPRRTQAHRFAARVGDKML